MGQKTFGHHVEYHTLVDLLRSRASQQPEQLAFTFLADGETEENTITYAALDRRACAIAAELQGFCRQGDRAILLYPAGLEFVEAFFGCLYAGIVAVPVYPPRLNRPMPRIRAIVADAQAGVALTTTSILSSMQRRFEHEPELAALRWLATDGYAAGGDDGRWRTPPVTESSLAFLQYTSGSTRTPRGVMLSHGNLLSNLALMNRELAIDPQGRGVFWLPLYHDMGLIGGVLMPLYVGAPAILMAPGSFIERPVRWLQAISRYRGTVSGGPNFAFDFCVDRIPPEDRSNLDLSSWQVAFCGAEPIRAETLERFALTYAPYGFRREAFCPSYGLAEATLMVTAGLHLSTVTVDRLAVEHHRVELAADGGAGQTFVGCGLPAPGQVAAIVDPESQVQCPPDRIGEIWVASPSVARGYWNRPQETAYTFQAYLSDTRAGPFLRTGDLGFLRDGELFVAGRLKDLIIIRGRNYYAHDIEQSVERSHPALQPGGGATFSIDMDGEAQLAIVHEVKRGFRHVDIEEVARAIRRVVADDQELPVSVVALVKPGRLPRTSSGKTQRYLCRERYLAGDLETTGVSLLDRAGPAAEVEFAFDAPGSPIEVSLLEICSAVLGAQRVGIHDNFFERGGDSILAAQVVARVRETFRVEISLLSLFENPSVAGLAHQVEMALNQDAPLPVPPLRPMPRNGYAPLAFSQERMWFIHQLQPESSAYNMATAVRLKGRLDVAALAHSFEEIVRRHQILSTTFQVVDGQPTQVTAPTVALAMPVVNLQLVPETDRLARAMQCASEEAQRSFDLSRGPLLRVTLFQLDREDHILQLAMHHAVSDAWSLGVIAREVIALYRAAVEGNPLQLPPLPIQYADFAVWQRQWLQGETLERQMAYWRRQLHGVSVLELPTDRPRPAMQSYRGSYQSIPLSASLLDALKRLSSRSGVTPFMTLLAAFKTLLSRYAGQTDIAVGTPIANRQWLAVEGLIGTFVNTLVVRSDLSGDPSFRDLLKQIREVALDAYAHQDLPFAKLVAELQPERDLSHSPLFQVMFNVINVPMPAIELPGLTATPLEVDRRGAQFDLTLTVTDMEHLRLASIEYNTDLFYADTIARMLGHFEKLLAGIVADPDRRISELPIVTEAERRQLLVDWNDTTADYSRDRGVHQLFEAQVERAPNTVAVVHEGEELTYRDLNRRANHLAHYLRSFGVGSDTLVGVCLERSLEMIVALLGVLKAGGAYVPLDPAYPAERIGFMIEDAQMPILLTQQALVSSLPEHEAKLVCLDGDWPIIEAQSAENLNSSVSLNQLAYTIYTSGSTGQPKGVQITHRAVVNFLESMRHQPGLTETDALLAVTTLSFDIAGLEIFLPLSVGARVVLASREIAADGARLSELIARSGATVMQATPVTWRLLLESGWQGSSQLKILCGGEALPRDLADHLLDRCASLWNMYGPTETTIWSTIERVDRGARITIGRPIANTRIYVLDGRLEPMPIGIPGDLYIGGDGLALGYLNRPELTAAKFVRDPFDDRPGARMYKTGDLARYLSDGSVEYLGRTDHQVKVRGFRIELGEIEAVLEQHPAVRQAAVLAREDGRADRRLVAYLVPADGQSPDGLDLRKHLKRALPDYMLPSAFVPMAEFPLTPNRKVDRRALPAPGTASLDVSHDYVAPRSVLEAQLVHIWQAVLGVQTIGVTDNFFDLGGHSLLVVRMFAEIETALGAHLPMATIFEAPTVEQLAAILEHDGWSPTWSSLIAIQPGGSRPPFYCVHEFDGNVFYYRDLARHLGEDQPLFGLQAQGLDGTTPPQDSIEEMAAHYVREMRSFQPQGPYYLGGSSMGGMVAFEMARQLHAQGQAVGLLALFDSFSIGYLRLLSLPARHRIARHLKGLAKLSLKRRLAYVVARVRPRLNYARWLRAHVEGIQWRMKHMARIRLLKQGHPLPPDLLDLHMRTMLTQAQGRYSPEVYAGKVTFFQAEDQPRQYYHDPHLDQRAMAASGFLAGGDDDPMWNDFSRLGWGALAAGGLEVHQVAGSHGTIIREPYVEALAAKLRACIDASLAQKKETLLPGRVESRLERLKKNDHSD